MLYSYKKKTTGEIIVFYLYIFDWLYIDFEYEDLFNILII